MVKTTAFQAYSLPGGGLVRRKRNLPALAGSGLVFLSAEISYIRVIRVLFSEGRERLRKIKKLFSVSLCAPA